MDTDILIPSIIFFLIFISPIVLGELSVRNQRFAAKFNSFNISMQKKMEKYAVSMDRGMPLFIDKWGETMIRAIAKLFAIGVTIFLILHEFPELKENQNFMVALVIWGMYGVLVFWFDYRKAKAPLENKVDKLVDKMDELITKLNNNTEKTDGKYINL
ncbi:MAG: hypothetical protein ABID87_04280 [Chloroflexota bacterium]